MATPETRDIAIVDGPSEVASPAASWIERTSDVCGGDARIRRTRITVAGLVEWRRLGLSDEEIVASISGLTPADLQVAWDYYERNPEEIDQAIREDAEA